MNGAIDLGMPDHGAGKRNMQAGKAAMKTIAAAAAFIVIGLTGGSTGALAQDGANLARPHHRCLRHCSTSGIWQRDWQRYWRARPVIVVQRRAYIAPPPPSAWDVYQSLRRPYLCYLPSEWCDNTQRLAN